MRVIKEGKKEKEITCQYCGSELAYTFDDVKNKQLPFGYIKTCYIECPVCNKHLEVEGWNNK